MYTLLNTQSDATNHVCPVRSMSLYYGYLLVNRREGINLWKLGDVVRASSRAREDYFTRIEEYPLAHLEVMSSYTTAIFVKNFKIYATMSSIGGGLMTTEEQKGRLLVYSPKTPNFDKEGAVLYAPVIFS